MFQIRRVALRDNRADDEDFERRKAAYQAFVEKRAGDLAGGRAEDGGFSTEEKLRTRLLSKYQMGPLEKLTLLNWRLPGHGSSASR